MALLAGNLPSQLVHLVPNQTYLHISFSLIEDC